MGIQIFIINQLFKWVLVGATGLLSLVALAAFDPTRPIDVNQFENSIANRLMYDLLMAPTYTEAQLENLHAELTFLNGRGISQGGTDLINWLEVTVPGYWGPIYRYWRPDSHRFHLPVRERSKIAQVSVDFFSQFFGHSFLTAAVSTNHWAAIEILLRKHSQPDYYLIHWKDPLGLAVRLGKPAIVKRILPYYRSFSYVDFWFTHFIEDPERYEAQLQHFQSMGGARAENPIYQLAALLWYRYQTIPRSNCSGEISVYRFGPSSTLEDFAECLRLILPYAEQLREKLKERLDSYDGKQIESSRAASRESTPPRKYSQTRFTR